MKLCTRRVDSTVLAHRKHSVNVTVLGIANVIVLWTRDWMLYYTRKGILFNEKLDSNLAIIFSNWTAPLRLTYQFYIWITRGNLIDIER